MKQLSILIAFLAFSLASFCQSIKKDANGNYIQVKDTAVASMATNTGKTFTTAKGEVYPVWISKNGKLFIIRTSKNGNQYKQYLKVDTGIVQVPQRKILKTITDNRGLTSVLFVEGKDTLALDYLTRTEFKQMFH